MIIIGIIRRADRKANKTSLRSNITERLDNRGRKEKFQLSDKNISN